MPESAIGPPFDSANERMRASYNAETRRTRPPRPVDPPFISARFCWTEKGKRVHITDDGLGTRCGWPVTSTAAADDVVWHWPPCGKCSNEH